MISPCESIQETSKISVDNVVLTEHLVDKNLVYKCPLTSN